MSDPLKVRQRLACIAEDTICVDTIHKFMSNTGKKIVTCQLQNANSNLTKFCKVYARQNKKKSDKFTYTFSRNHGFNSSINSRFQEAFLVKVIYTKKYTTCT